MFDQRTLILALKPAAAVAGTLLLLWEFRDQRRGISREHHLRRWSLAVLGAVAFASWWNLGFFHFAGRYLHTHEFFHYYVGAKYFNELGYTRLYDCAAAAEIEEGRRSDVSRRWIRDLRTNEVRRGSPALSDPSVCRPHFSNPRWEEFSHDVLWFRDQLGPEKWLALHVDHGYNASPLWTAVGTVLANTGPVSTEKLRILGLIDPLLLVVMWAVVWWAFGWRVMCVALLWWGTNIPGGFAFVGGAFLRQDWLLLSVAGVALTRRGYDRAGGFALAWASLLRLFPALLVAGLATKATLDLWNHQTWRISRAQMQFVTGMCLAAAIGFSVSIVALGGVQPGIKAWIGFQQNTRKHASSPSPNRLGLAQVVTFDPDLRAATFGQAWLDAPWDTWTAARIRKFEERRGVYWILVLAFLPVFVRAVAKQSDWVALVLGATLIPILLSLSNYYLGYLLVLALLWPFPLAGIGIGLCVLSVFTGIVAAMSDMQDDQAAATSVAVVLLVWLVVATLAFKRSWINPIHSRSS